MSQSAAAKKVETVVPAENQPPVNKSDKFPPGIPFIVGNEGAERFSYYGMRQVLFVHLSALFMGFAAKETLAPEAVQNATVHATQVTHLFMAGVYMFPMIGAILADRLLGKYRVIFWVSLLYVAGHGVLALAGRLGTLGNFPAAEMGMFVGLVLISVGSGGIKPCVSANVGDQFGKENGHLITKVFQIFYFIINFGSVYASFFIPVFYYMDKEKPLHERIGPELAFGVPGLLMALAAVVFWFGRNKYVKYPPKPGGKLGLLDFLSSSLLATPLLMLVWKGAGAAEEVVNAFMSDQAGAVGHAFATVASEYWIFAVVAAVGFALGLALFSYRQRLTPDMGFLATMLYAWQKRSERKAGEGFFEPARQKFGDEVADGPAAVLRIIVVFSMVSVFWALFDQQTSTWVAQAESMDLMLRVPAWFPGYALFLSLAGGAVGAAWLFLWVSNIKAPRWVWIGATGALVLVAIPYVLGYGTEIIDVGLEAAQISALNPLMVMIIIPLLNVGLYGPLEKRGKPMKPLVRMSVGMALAAASFVIVALLQARIEGAPKGSVHVLWQVLPYLVITAAEVMVSITGLEFAYTQAPRSMKSTIMGFWLLCVTFGNILVAFLAPLEKLSLSTFFWVFAGLIGAAAAIFMVLASRYKGKTYLQDAGSH